MNKTIVKMLHGSHLYGMNTPSSDLDYKGIVLPTREQILLGQADFTISESTGDDKSKNNSDDVDIQMFSLQKFLKMAVQGETVVIDMLHAPENMILESSELWKEIQDNRSMFYTKNMKAYLGYVRKQASKYGIRGSRLSVMEEALGVAKKHTDSYSLGEMFDLLPINEYSFLVETDHPSMGKQHFYEICGRKYQSTLKIPMFIDQLQRVYDSYGERAKLAKENEGIDWKAVSHSIRAGYQLYHIYKDGDFSYPLPDTDFIMQVKKGELDFLTEVQPELERIVNEVTVLAEKSSYPEKVNIKEVNKLIMKVHKEIVNEI